MVRTQRLHCGGPGSIPGQGTKITQAMRRGPKYTYMYMCIYMCVCIYIYIIKVLIVLRDRMTRGETFLLHAFLYLPKYVQKENISCVIRKNIQ